MKFTPQPLKNIIKIKNGEIMHKGVKKVISHKPLNRKIWNINKQTGYDFLLCNPK